MQEMLLAVVLLVIQLLPLVPSFCTAAISIAARNPSKRIKSSVSSLDFSKTGARWLNIQRLAAGSNSFPIWL